MSNGNNRSFFLCREIKKIIILFLNSRQSCFSWPFYPHQTEGSTAHGTITLNAQTFFQQFNGLFKSFCRFFISISDDSLTNRDSRSHFHHFFRKRFHGFFTRFPTVKNMFDISGSTQDGFFILRTFFPSKFIKSRGADLLHQLTRPNNFTQFVGLKDK